VKKSVLFISYDGLLDPLGGSQILPYIYGISAHPRHVHILSFEKPERFAFGEQVMRLQLQSRSIGWTPLLFTSGGGKFGKIWDLLRMYLTALVLHAKHRFDVVHCRSYQAMQVGSLLARVSRVRTIFDMRGLWVDERLDGGIWSTHRLIDRLAYRTYKSIERKLLVRASHVIALTERVRAELRTIAPAMTAPVTVIPCCADFSHFGLPGGEQRTQYRTTLGIAQDELVIAYLGSLGTWYMLEEMLGFFREASLSHGHVRLLLITHDWRPEHEALACAQGISGTLRNRVIIKPATREEVPSLLGAADCMLSFIKPAYSKLASSPTKMAEALAMGVPVISNAGIGDVDLLTTSLDAGAVVDLSDPAAVARAIQQLPLICRKGGQSLRDRAFPVLDLDVAQRKYRAVYDQLEMGV
jgi:glycosyltransferase involved in cell wall biosynthesis